MLSARSYLLPASLAIFVWLGGCAGQPQVDERERLLDLAADVEAQGDAVTAAAMYERAAEMSPDDPSVALRLGNARLASNDFSGAAKAFRAVLADDIDHPEALLGLGTAQLRQGETEVAARNLGRAAMRLNQRTAWTRLGIAEAMLGDGEQAAQAFTHALALAPNDPDAQTNLALAESLAGDQQRALARMQQVCDSPLAESRHYRNLLLVMVLAGQAKAARYVEIPDLPAAQRKALIERAGEIRRITDPSQRARAMGLVAGPSSGDPV